MYWLGIDIGTGGSRALLVDPQGRIRHAVTVAHEEMRMEHPLWAEQRPENWWDASRAAIAAVLKESGVSFDKIPFTCSYLPGKANLPYSAGLYFGIFATYSTAMASIGYQALTQPRLQPLLSKIGGSGCSRGDYASPARSCRWGPRPGPGWCALRS